MTHHYEGPLGNKQLGVGAVDVQDPNIETGAQVAARISVYRWLDPNRRSSPAPVVSTTCHGILPTASFSQ
jgi:hypothetical protein